MVNSVAAIATASLICLQAGAAGEPAYGLERHVVVANDMRQAIVEIYISNAGTGNWQQDALGSDYSLTCDGERPSASCCIEAEGHTIGRLPSSQSCGWVKRNSQSMACTTRGEKASR